MICLGLTLSATVIGSGQVATEYFDKYLFEADPALLSRVAREMVQLLPADTELLGGLELGGIPLATMVSQLTGTPARFIRKEAKSHGLQRRSADIAEKAGSVHQHLADACRAALHEPPPPFPRPRVDPLPNSF